MLAADQISLSLTDKVQFQSSEFLKALVQNPAEVAENLKVSFPSFDLNQITVDSNGIIIIDNEEIKKLVKKAILDSSINPLANWFGCGNGSNCSI